MKNKSNLELVSEQILKGNNILNHISYWSYIQTQTAEDSEKQKLSLKEYPIIIYNWNEDNKKLLANCLNNTILSDFIEDDNKLVSLKDVNIEIDNGYRSREVFNHEKEIDPIAEKFAIESNLEIIERVMRKKIGALKEFFKQESQDEKGQQKNTVQIIEVLQKNNGQLEIFINKDYVNSIKPYRMGGDDGLWNKVAEIARYGSCDNRDGMVKYFNSNANNPIYKKLGYEKTKILTDDGNSIKSEIEIKIIKQEKINRSNGQKIKIS